MDPDDRDRLDRLERRDAVQRLDRKIAGERRGFAVHALVYALVIPTLWAVYFATPIVQGVPPWPLWTMFGWGMGLLGHGLGMRQKVRRLQERRDDALLAAAPPRPEIALPPEPDDADATLARAEALLRRERAR